MPHSGGTGDRPYSGYSQDAAPQRPVLQRVGRYYNLHGQHAQDHSVINNHGYPGSRDERPRRSPPPDLYEGSNPPPRNPDPKHQAGNRNPQRDGPEFDEAHQFTSAVRQPASSPSHPEVTAVKNVATLPAPGFQATLAGALTGIPNPLHYIGDEKVFSVCRNGKAEVLYKIIQTEIRYDKDKAEVPYSILGFRLERGEDEKRCLEVKLTGDFTHDNRYKNVTVKNLHHVPSAERTLAELQIQKTSTGQSQFQVGFNSGKPVALATISDLKSTQYTVTKRQRIDSHFNDPQAEGKFNLTLALDDGVESDSELSVAESVFFCIVLRLEEERQPMQLSLKADIRYASGSHWSFLGSKSKVVSNSFTKDYSGHVSHDIIKH